MPMTGDLSDQAFLIIGRVLLASLREVTAWTRHHKVLCHLTADQHRPLA